jgi:hypothetical protein
MADEVRTTGREPAEGANPEVDHPVHYNTHPSGVECIDIVRHMGFNLGNVVKYLWRDGIKDTEVEIQDLEKALWYLQDEINQRTDAKAMALAQKLEGQIGAYFDPLRSSTFVDATHTMITNSDQGPHPHVTWCDSCGACICHDKEKLKERCKGSNL